MKRAEVLEHFRLKAFDEIKVIKRANKDVYGELFERDLIECTDDMFEYLTKTNPAKRAFVKKLETPKTEETKIVKKTNTRRKTIAKK